MIIDFFLSENAFEICNSKIIRIIIEKYLSILLLKKLWECLRNNGCTGSWGILAWGEGNLGEVPLGGL